LPIEADGHNRTVWTNRPVRAGPPQVLADIESMPPNSLRCSCTGAPLSSCGFGDTPRTTALVGTAGWTTPRMCLMRFQGGARCILAAASQLSAILNNFSIQVLGSRAGLEWAGEDPDNALRSHPVGSRRAYFVAGVPCETPPLAVEGPARPAAIPGYVEGFANLSAGRAN